MNERDSRRQVVTATHDDEEYFAQMIARVIVEADLPAARYLIPDDDQRQAMLTSIFRLELEDVRERGGIIRTVSGREAVALWTYHRGPDEPEPQLTARLEKAAGKAAPRLHAFYQALDARRRELLGDQPHWHLRILAVRSDHQRQGFGGLLVRNQLATIDRVGEPTYVEAPTEELSKTLQSLGFPPIGPPLVHGDGCTQIFPALHRPTRP